MKIGVGELITLSDNKEYICFDTVTYNGIDYVYLMSNFKPLEIKFGVQMILNDQINIKIINDQKEKQMVLKLFEHKHQTSIDNNQSN